MIEITRLCFIIALAGAVCLVNGFENDERNLPNGDRGSRIGDSWGHSSNGRVNQFGNDYKNVGENWAQLCLIDTDGDGFTNGEELGDPDCTWRVGDANPALISDPTDSLSVPGNPGEIEVQDGGLFAFFSNYPTYLLFHALFMFTAWAILAPMGIYVAMTQRTKEGSWFKYHRGLMLASGATTLLGFGTLFMQQGVGNVFEFAHTHGTIGVIVVGGTMFNLLLGVFRPHVDEGTEKSGNRILFETIHPWVGRLILAMGVYQIGTGLPLLFNTTRGSIIAYMYWGLMVIMFAQALYRKIKNSNNTPKQRRPVTEHYYSAEDKPVVYRGNHGTAL